MYLLELLVFLVTEFVIGYADNNEGIDTLFTGSVFKNFFNLIYNITLNKKKSNKNINRVLLYFTTATGTLSDVRFKEEGPQLHMQDILKSFLTQTFSPTSEIVYFPD